MKTSVGSGICCTNKGLSSESVEEGQIVDARPSVLETTERYFKYYIELEMVVKFQHALELLENDKLAEFLVTSDALFTQYLNNLAHGSTVDEDDMKSALKHLSYEGFEGQFRQYYHLKNSLHEFVHEDLDGVPPASETLPDISESIRLDVESEISRRI